MVADRAAEASRGLSVIAAAGLAAAGLDGVRLLCSVTEIALSNEMGLNGHGFAHVCLLPATSFRFC